MRRHFHLAVICVCAFSVLASARYLFIKTGAAPAFTPASLTSLRLWLDSADVLNGSNPTHNTKFATWNDKSGNGFNFTQATSGNQFTYGSAQVNGIDVVVADGAANTSMGNSTTFLSSTGTAYTIFLTVELTSLPGGGVFTGQLKNSNGNGSVMGMTSTGIQFVQNSSWLGSNWTTTNTTSTIYMIEYGYNGSGGTTAGNYLCRKNGTTLSRSGNDNGAGGTTSALGSDIVDPSLAMSGYLLDFVVQAAVATGTEETNMLAYEKAKWGF